MFSDEGSVALTTGDRESGIGASTTDPRSRSPAASHAHPPAHRLPRRPRRPRREGHAVRRPARRRRPGGARRALRSRGRRRDHLPRHLGERRGARDAARRGAAHGGAAVHPAHDRRRRALGGRRRARAARGRRQGAASTPRRWRGRRCSRRARSASARSAWSRASTRSADADAAMWRVYVRGRREAPTDLDAVAWARECVARGAGEILLTSIDRDGARTGYDLALTRAVADAVNVPVIASGGAGERGARPRRARRRAAPTRRWSRASCTTASRRCARSSTRCGRPASRARSDRRTRMSEHLLTAVADVARVAGDVALRHYRDDAPRGDEGRRLAGHDRRPRGGAGGARVDQARASRPTGSSARSRRRVGHRARRRWIIDPIDGTKTFVRGVPLWGTLVAWPKGIRRRVRAECSPARRTSRR